MLIKLEETFYRLWGEWNGIERGDKERISKGRREWGEE
jgi:hypothetical protein